MTDFDDQLKAAIKPDVDRMAAAFRTAAASKFGQSRGRKGKGARLSTTFKPSIRVDTDGWGVIRFKTNRYAYILHHGHDKMEVTRKKPHSTTYTKGHLKTTHWLSPIQSQYVPLIANSASKLSADFVVKNLLNESNTIR